LVLAAFTEIYRGISNSVKMWPTCGGTLHKDQCTFNSCSCRRHYLLCYLFTSLVTYLLCPWSRVLLENLTGFRLVKKFPSFCETRRFFYQSHKCPSPVPILSQLDPFRTPTSHFLKNHLNIMLPSTPGSPQWSLSLRFPHDSPVHAAPLSHTCYMPRLSHPSRFYHPNNIG